MPKPRRVSNLKKQAAPITSLPLPKGVKTVVVYGGSFDPPHVWHMCASIVLRLMFRERSMMLYVPAAHSPLKPNGPIASDDQRLAMLQLGNLIQLPGSRRKPCPTGWHGIIWTDEIDRSRWEAEHHLRSRSYTIDTLRRLKSIIPANIQLRLLIGTDQAVQFHRWKKFREVMRLAEPVVVLRPPHKTPKMFLHALDSSVWNMKERLAWAERIVPSQPVYISSTDIRKYIARQPLNYKLWDTSRYIDPNLANYIIKHSLYGVGTKYKLKPIKPARKR